MRLHRFYVNEKIGDKAEMVILSAELTNQLQNVFRLKKDDLIIIFDGSGFDYECAIVNIVGENVSLSINKKERSRYMPTRDVYLCAAVVKKDTFEWIVEKATELGVTRIIPIMAERSEKKSLNEERLKKIAVEASEQSGRGNIPIIENIMTTEDALKLRANSTSVTMVFHVEGRNFKRSYLDKNLPISIFIGPEGGWSPKEIEMFHKNNIDIYCLGNQVLRSETAVITALSQILFEV